MRIIALPTLRNFWESNPAYADAKIPLEAWYTYTRKANWTSPAELKTELRNASILKEGRVIFNIAGNKYRLVVKINYHKKIVFIRFIGTHEQYDAIDAQTI
ncbi:MAG: type II toxin-antitoxin system HigB family toxin [Deltaproteobacteria bacterium]|jgi:mRNA interferase HigB|nr:type II toxin-antitoxin system HigB family toxin [Deltaproteobacteria bacterium]